MVPRQGRPPALGARELGRARRLRERGHSDVEIGRRWGCIPRRSAARGAAVAADGAGAGAAPLTARHLHIGVSRSRGRGRSPAPARPARRWTTRFEHRPRRALPPRPPAQRGHVLLAQTSTSATGRWTQPPQRHGHGCASHHRPPPAITRDPTAAPLTVDLDQAQVPGIGHALQHGLCPSNPNRHRQTIPKLNTFSRPTRRQNSQFTAPLSYFRAAEMHDGTADDRQVHRRASTGLSHRAPSDFSLEGRNYHRPVGRQRGQAP